MQPAAALCVPVVVRTTKADGWIDFGAARFIRMM